MSDLWLEIEIDDFYEKSATFFFALTIFSQQCIYIWAEKKMLYKNTKIPSRNSGATCIFQSRPFPTNFSRQSESYGPKLCT